MWMTAVWRTISWPAAKDRRAGRSCRPSSSERDFPGIKAQEALDKSYTQDDAKEAIRRLAEKKHYDPERSTPQEKQKICAYLVRKGFRYEDVRQVIQVSDWNA